MTTEWDLLMLSIIWELLNLFMPPISWCLCWTILLYKYVAHFIKPYTLYISVHSVYFIVVGYFQLFSYPNFLRCHFLRSSSEKTPASHGTIKNNTKQEAVRICYCLLWHTWGVITSHPVWNLILAVYNICVYKSVFPCCDKAKRFIKSISN